MKKVLVVMGSDSDLKVMEKCIDRLASFGVPAEVRICSAHRTPAVAEQLAKNAAGEGFGVIIAAAGKAAHLGGVLAASLSTTGKIGVYLHGDYPVLNDFATGFYQGASTVNPDIKIFTAYGAGVSGDSPRAAELTKIMFNNGADVVYGAAGSANPGLFQNVIDLGGFEKGYYAIGVDYDQWQTYKNSNSPEMADVIISSVVKKAGDSVVTAWSKLESGEASWGDTLMFGLAEGSVGLAENEYYLECTPADVQETVNEYKEKVSSGEIAVKSYFDFASHDEFLTYQAQFAG